MARLRVKVDLVDGLRLTIANDFHWEFPEDEITLVFVEETRQNLISSVARPLALANMTIHNVTLERVSYIEYEDHKLLTEERDRYGNITTEHEQLDVEGLIEEILLTVPYKLACAEHKRQLEREQQEKLALDARQQMQREMSQLTRLKAKYEDE